MKHFEINELIDTSDTTTIVYSALTEDDFTPDEDLEGQSPVFMMDASANHLRSISVLERQIRQLINTTDTGFDIGLRHGQKCILNTNSAGDSLIILRKLHWEVGMHAILKTKQLNPYLDLMFRVWGYISDLSWLSCYPHEVMRDGELAAEKYNRSLHHLRQYAKSSEFKKCCTKWFTESSNSFRSTKCYVEYLFQQHARLLVIRLDFGFRVGSDLRSDLLECRSRFKRLLNNQDHNSLFDHQVGYIWRLEFGLEKGWHYHCIFFFDGSKSRQDVTIGDAIGEYWKDVITDGQGTYWNCNRHKKRFELFKTLGIGMIHFEDDCKRENLMQAATYLCKVDEYLRQALPEGVEGVRTFGRGEIPRIATNPAKMGRPRVLDTAVQLGGS